MSLNNLEELVEKQTPILQHIFAQCSNEKQIINTYNTAVNFNKTVGGFVLEDINITFKPKQNNSYYKLSAALAISHSGTRASLVHFLFQIINNKNNTIIYPIRADSNPVGTARVSFTTTQYKTHNIELFEFYFKLFDGSIIYEDDFQYTIQIKGCEALDSNSNVRINANSTSTLLELLEYGDSFKNYTNINVETIKPHGGATTNKEIEIF